MDACVVGVRLVDDLEREPPSEFAVLVTTSLVGVPEPFRSQALVLRVSRASPPLLCVLLRVCAQVPVGAPSRVRVVFACPDDAVVRSSTRSRRRRRRRRRIPRHPPTVPDTWTLCVGVAGADAGATPCEVVGQNDDLCALAIARIVRAVANEAVREMRLGYGLQATTRALRSLCCCQTAFARPVPFVRAGSALSHGPAVAGGGGGGGEVELPVQPRPHQRPRPQPWAATAGQELSQRDQRGGDDEDRLEMLDRQDRLLDQLQRDIDHINQLAAQISAEVEEQSKMLSELDDHVECASVNVEQGVTELAKAVKYQRSYRRLCCVALLCPALLPVLCCWVLLDKARGVRGFDHLFADQEMAFNVAARALARALPTLRPARFRALPIPSGEKGGGRRWWRAGGGARARMDRLEDHRGALSWKGVLCALGTWVPGLLVGLPVALCASLAAFVPGVILLLLARPGTVETQTTKFVQRQVRIAAERTRKQALRVLRYLSRTLAMLGFLVAWPVWVVRQQQCRGDAGAVVSCRTADALLVLHVSLVLVMQGLGVVRATVSWVQRTRTGEDDAGARHRNAGTPTAVSFRNMAAIVTLGLEAAQLCVLPFREDEATGRGSDSAGAHGIPWAPGAFRVVYGQALGLARSPMALSWAAVAAAVVLVATMGAEFVRELRAYGLYMRHGDTAGTAREYFFWSFMGAVVFGHGKAAHMAGAARAVVAVLADTLFLPVAFHLLEPLVCVTRQGRETMVAADGVECWRGTHLWLAQACAVAFGAFVSLSVLVAPMLLGNAPANAISFVKAYAMLAVLGKTVLLVGTALVAGAGGGEDARLVVALASCTALSAMSVVWYARAPGHDPGWWFSSHKLIARCKICAYTAGALSTAVVLVARRQPGGHDGGAETALLAVWGLLLAAPFVWHFRLRLLGVPKPTSLWLRAEELPQNNNNNNIGGGGSSSSSTERVLAVECAWVDARGRTGFAI